MTHQRQAGFLAATFLTTLAAIGCLERAETITVARDGGATIEIEYKGNAGDFKTVDAMPSAASGWRVQRSVTKKTDEDEHTLTSKRRFAAGENLPRNYAAPDDEDSDLYLDFPTTIEMERRRDGVYYHFRRVYTPRPWAYVQYWSDRFFDDDVKKLGEKPTEELTDDERASLFKAFTEVQAHEQVELAKAARDEALPNLPQRHWLLARSAMLRAYREIDFADVVEEYESLDEDERQERSERQTEELAARALDAFSASLRADARLSPADLERFAAAYDRARRSHQITGQLGGHSFRINVRLPGTVVAHNADKLAGDVASWEFNGSAFRDRPFELMITSRVDRGED